MTRNLLRSPRKNTGRCCAEWGKGEEAGEGDGEHGEAEGAEAEEGDGRPVILW